VASLAVGIMGLPLALSLPRHKKSAPVLVETTGVNQAAPGIKQAV
jgi:hypothetical protein